MKLLELLYHGDLSVHINLSEGLVSFIFKLESLFSERKCPPKKLYHKLEALNMNTHRHENHQILHQASTVPTVWHFYAVYCNSISVVQVALPMKVHCKI
jgi:hypothetical protein